jgi:GGDEF domain-containing protein
MISIKQFLEQRGKGSGPKHDLVDALGQMGRLLLDAMATYVVRGTEADVEVFRRQLNRLARQMEGPQTAMTVLGATSDAVEALETYCESTAEYHRLQRVERQSMVAMLTATVADLAGQTDVSVGRLHTIEKQMERAQELDDIRALKANLGESLNALREAAAQQRSTSVATMEQLRNQIAMARMQVAENPKAPARTQGEIEFVHERSGSEAEPGATTYVAAVQLRRAEHIASRFGEPVRHRMLGMIGTQLKTMLRPGDRLLRWKGSAFVMFLNSRESIGQIRTRLADTVSITSQQYIEVGSRTSLLSVGVDWIVFPQADHSSLEEVFTEVDTFLANFGQATPPGKASR